SRSPSSRSTLGPSTPTQPNDRNHWRSTPSMSEGQEIRGVPPEDTEQTPAEPPAGPEAGTEAPSGTEAPAGTARSQKHTSAHLSPTRPSSDLSRSTSQRSTLGPTTPTQPNDRNHWRSTPSMSEGQEIRGVPPEDTEQTPAEPPAGPEAGTEAPSGTESPAGTE